MTSGDRRLLHNRNIRTMRRQCRRAPNRRCPVNPKRASKRHARCRSPIRSKCARPSPSRTQSKCIRHNHYRSRVRKCGHRNRMWSITKRLQPNRIRRLTATTHSSAKANATECPLRQAIKKQPFQAAFFLGGTDPKPDRRESAQRLRRRRAIAASCAAATASSPCARARSRSLLWFCSASSAARLASFALASSRS